MARQRVFLLSVTLMAMAAMPALGQEAAPVSGPARAQSTASTPDFFGVWNHPSFPWYEPPASGPGPVTNRSRWPYIVNQQPSLGGSPGLPPSKEGVSDYDQLVGDYTNPILQPWAAEVVKKFGEIARRHHLSEHVQPVLARTGAVYFQACTDADDSAGGQDHDLVR